MAEPESTFDVEGASVPSDPVIAWPVSETVTSELVSSVPKNCGWVGWPRPNRATDQARRKSAFDESFVGIVRVKLPAVTVCEPKV